MKTGKPENRKTGKQENIKIPTSGGKLTVALRP
jgi:hypothetical protein